MDNNKTNTNTYKVLVTTNGTNTITFKTSNVILTKLKQNKQCDSIEMSGQSFVNPKLNYVGKFVLRSEQTIKRPQGGTIKMLGVASQSGCFSTKNKEEDSLRFLTFAGIGDSAVKTIFIDTGYVFLFPEDISENGMIVNSQLLINAAKNIEKLV